MRDDFSKVTKDILAKRVGFKCSNPNCKRITIGPHTIDEKVINLGVAAHISAASKGGPRFCEKMGSDERISIKNGIWLCQNCAKLIDNDTNKYSANDLICWKSLAEKESLSVISSEFIKENKNATLFDKRIKVYEKLFYELREADTLINELINTRELSTEEKKAAAYYLGLQIAKFAEDNSFYIQDEIIVQCVGTFVGVNNIFSTVEGISKENLENYKRNFRASQRLLKQVDSKGLINTSKKTALMAYYCDLETKQEKDDFI